MHLDGTLEDEVHYLEETYIRVSSYWFWIAHVEEVELG